MADAKPVKRHGDGGKHWVVHQHQEVTVITSNERPNEAVAKGERVKVIHGPFSSREAAQERADMIYSKTTKARLERLG